MPVNETETSNDISTARTLRLGDYDICTDDRKVRRLDRTATDFVGGWAVYAIVRPHDASFLESSTSVQRTGASDKPTMIRTTVTLPFTYDGNHKEVSISSTFDSAKVYADDEWVTSFLERPTEGGSADKAIHLAFGETLPSETHIQVREEIKRRMKTIDKECIKSSWTAKV
ncbi:uncharacterized protein IL334_007928 [Kwoniella shivajii]|uniref:Uncharacterized protein n=1 Tax=Kwoniella shivajii TaxID=564305 RepID=A0ABZ1DA23_9TREE|nr:hypothetical protein IL334_007928 [Kwoniella shivajii]